MSIFRLYKYKEFMKNIVFKAIVYDNSELFIEKQIELLKLIIDKGADINAKDNKGKTALMLAIESNNKYISEFFIQQYADIST